MNDPHDAEQNHALMGLAGWRRGACSFHHDAPHRQGGCACHHADADADHGNDSRPRGR